jgi:hypothetical protein
MIDATATSGQAWGYLRTQMKRRRKMKRQTLFFGIFATTILTVPAFAAGDNAGITGVHWGRNAFAGSTRRCSRVWLGGKPCKGRPAAPAFGG